MASQRLINVRRAVLRMCEANALYLLADVNRHSLMFCGAFLNTPATASMLGLFVNSCESCFLKFFRKTFRPFTHRPLALHCTVVIVGSPRLTTRRKTMVWKIIAHTVNYSRKFSTTKIRISPVVFDFYFRAPPPI